MYDQLNINENDEQVKIVMQQIITAAIKHRKLMDSFLANIGIFSSQHHILLEMSRNQFASQKELADRMGVSSATIAVSLKKLENGGYISKEMDNADNRLNQITLTEKGIDVVQKSRQIFNDLNLKVFDDFDITELEDLSKLLYKLISKLNLIDRNLKST